MRVFDQLSKMWELYKQKTLSKEHPMFKVFGDYEHILSEQKNYEEEYHNFSNLGFEEEAQECRDMIDSLEWSRMKLWKRMMEDFVKDDWFFDFLPEK